MSSREVSSFPSSTFVTPQRAAFSGDRFTDLPTSLKSSTTSPLIPSTGKATPTSAESDRKGKRGKPIRVLFATDAQPEDGGEVPSVIVVTPAKNVETEDITPSPSPAARNARASSPSLRSQSASLGGYSTSLSAARSPSNLATGRAKGENFSSSPDDVRRRRQREKQVSYGELTKGYGNMIALIEHDPLLKCGGILPLSPPEILWSSKRNYGSKRSWDVRLRKWRRALHMFDSVFIDGVHPEDQRQVILEEQRQQWVSAAFADEPREKRVKLSQEELMAVMNSPNVPTKIPVEENLCCILRDENCYESVRNVVPLSASSLIKGTDISPLEAGIKIHIAPSSAVLQRQMERQNGNSPHAINPNLPYTHSLMPCATSPSPKKPLESDLSSMTPNAQRLLNFNSLVNAQDGADKGNDTRVSGAKLTWSESPAPAKKATKETTSSDICTPAKEETPKTCEKASVRRGSSHATTNKNTSELAPTPPKEPTADKARRRATPDMDRCSHAYPHQQTWEMPPSMVPPSFYPPMAGVAPWCYPTPGGHPVMAPMPGMVYYPPYVYPMGPSPMMPYPPAMMMPHAACPMPYAPMPHPYMYPVPMPAHMAPSHDPRRKTQAPVTATKKSAKTAAAPLVTLLPNTHGSAAREKSSVKSE